MRTTGIYRALGGLNYFTAYKLPPRSPSLQLTPDLVSLYGEASHALGQIKGDGSSSSRCESFCESLRH